MNAEPPLLQLRGINKSFGAVKALTDIDLEVKAGEVVALVGDNGAGKSTVVKVLAGVHAADNGDILWKGEKVRIDTPLESQTLGIATVYQDLALCDNLDVVGNLFLGQETTGGGVLKEEEMERRSWVLLQQLSARIPSVRIAVAGLSGGQRQTVAIARSLVGDPAIVILDEPTAALGVAQTAEVLNLIERLRDAGLGVIVISHNMADVQAVSDRIVVLRLGRNNGVFDNATTTHEEIITAITGAADSSVTRRAAAKAAQAEAAAAAGAAEVAEAVEAAEFDDVVEAAEAVSNSTEGDDS